MNLNRRYHPYKFHLYYKKLKSPQIFKPLIHAIRGKKLMDCTIFEFTHTANKIYDYFIKSLIKSN